MKKVINSGLIVGILLTIATAVFAQNPIPGFGEGTLRYGDPGEWGPTPIESYQCNDVTTTTWIMVPIGPVFSIPMPVTTTTEVCEWVCISGC